MSVQDRMAIISLMDAEERGVLFSLVGLAEVRRAPIPLDDAPWLARFCGISTRKWNMIFPALVCAGAVEDRGGLLYFDQSFLPADLRDLFSGNGEETGEKRARNGRVKRVEKKTKANEINDPPEALACVVDITSSTEISGTKKTRTAENPQRVWERDEFFVKAWGACTHQMRKRSKSREKTWPDWRAAAVKAGGGERLLAALVAYLMDDPDVKRTGGPGFHIWLNDGKWEAALDADSPAMPLHQWAGPQTIREKVVGERGEGFARSYLDPAAWSGTAIVARTKSAATQLRELYAIKAIPILEPQEVAA